jgi:hypothetical protein
MNGVSLMNSGDHPLWRGLLGLLFLAAAVGCFMAARYAVDVTNFYVLIDLGCALLGDRRIARDFAQGGYATLKPARDLYKTQVAVGEATDFSPIQLACTAAMCDLATWQGGPGAPTTYRPLPSNNPGNLTMLAIRSTSSRVSRCAAERRPGRPEREARGPHPA